MKYNASVWIKAENLGGGFLELLAAIEPDDLPRIDAAIADLRAFRELCVARMTAAGKLIAVPVADLRVVKPAQEKPPGKPTPAAPRNPTSPRALTVQTAAQAIGSRVPYFHQLVKQTGWDKAALKRLLLANPDVFRFTAGKGWRPVSLTAAGLALLGPTAPGEPPTPSPATGASTSPPTSPDAPPVTS